MSRVEKIEQEVQALSAEELGRFRSWFIEYEWNAWDRQLESDAAAGKLDSLADEAIRQHAAGESTPL